MPPKYLAKASEEIESIRDGYVDLGTHCITAFVLLIFNVDFKSTLAEFFTPKWYGEFGMKRLISTFEDYITDYRDVLHPSMIDILAEELSNQLLVRYLGCIRNRGAKFRRQDPFADKLRDDVITAFGFFEQFPDFQDIKEKWRVIDGFSQLLTAEKSSIPAVYADFKGKYWDLQLSWVEAVLRARDDFNRDMLNGVKGKAATIPSFRGPESIMSKVK